MSPKLLPAAKDEHSDLERREEEAFIGLESGVDDGGVDKEEEEEQEEEEEEEESDAEQEGRNLLASSQRENRLCATRSKRIA